MKTTLLVVGRTVEQHYITAINDYIQRTKRFITFDMEVIPELKNTKSLSMEQQKEKEGELILKALQPGDVIVLAGKGHETYQEIQGVQYPMDEREIVAQYFSSAPSWERTGNLPAGVV